MDYDPSADLEKIKARLLAINFADDAVNPTELGVLEAGGYPLVSPTMSIGDSLMRPSGMLFRNLMSMELEALLRANPIDGVVLLTGCDNTAPAYMMGAASIDLPTEPGCASQSGLLMYVAPMPSVAA